MKHTTESTAPGLCILRALTTWNTSTTPSVLQRSMVVAMAQNIPLRLTVSLHVEIVVTLMYQSQKVPLLAVNQYWVVSSSPLNSGHLLNDISDHLQVGAGAIRRPVGHMELSHLVRLVSLTAHKDTDVSNVSHIGV